VSPNSEPLISVVVPVFNARQYLERVMDAIMVALDHFPGEVVVVDNGSTDGSLEFLRERWGDRVAILELPGPTIGAVRNFGARKAQASVLSFVDADCVITPDYFQRAFEVLERTGAAATGGPYDLPAEPHWVEDAWHRLHDRPGEREAGYVPAGNFVCRRAAFERVGGFDEIILTGEDAELCQRLWDSGYTIVQSPAVAAVHLGNPKSLRHFFRKQRWHGLGMFGTFRNRWLDRPVVMTFVHLVLNLVGIAAIMVSPSWVAGLAVAAACSVAVPVVTVAFRALSGRIRPPWLKGVLLYHIYFDARLAAILLLPGERRRSKARHQIGTR